jgi:hypothetical protein
MKNNIKYLKLKYLKIEGLNLLTIITKSIK